MKKLLSILVLVFMVAALTSCQSTTTDPSDDTITLTFWSHQNEAWNNSYLDVIDKFEAENPGIKVEYENFPYDDFESKVQTSLIEGTGGADIYEIWGGWAIDFVPAGALEEIPEELAAHIVDDTYEPTTGSLLYEGKLYGLPLEFNIESGAMIINKKIMESKGLEVPTTWEELVTTAAAGTEMDGANFKVKGFDFVNWDSVPYTFMSMILSQGGQYLTGDSTVDFNTTEAKIAFEELARLVTEENVTDLEGLVESGELEGYQALFADRVMMVPRGPWALSEGTEVFELTYGVDFDYVSMPWFSTEKKFASETGWALAVNSKTAQKEAAMKFLEFFYQDDILLAHNIRAAQIPPKKSVATDPALVAAMPYAEVLVPILENAQFIGHFNTDILKEQINNTFVGYVSGDYNSVDEALEDLNSKLDSLLK